MFPERYHVEQLKTPRQVRNAIAYVLNNWRRHGEDAGTRWTIDPYASGCLFDGWDRLFAPPESFVPLGAVRPQTWLLERGWRRYPPISPYEVPASRVSSSA